jgi:hypothetical protein
MRTLIVLVTLLGSMNAPAADATLDTQTIALSWELLRTAGYGHSAREHSAFLVARANGDLQLVRWAGEATSMSATYRGAIPAGTVAIVHTHPKSLPNPSYGDVALARKLNLPVYVLTRTSITRTSGGKTTELVAVGDWNPARSNVSVRGGDGR